MKGWAIFKHAVLMVLRNLPDVLRIFLVPWMCILGLAGIFLYATGLLSLLRWGETVPIPSGNGLMGPFFLVWVISGLLALWGVVAWHRFILLEELPTSIAPAFRSREIFAYLLKILQLVLIAIVVAIPFVFLIPAIASSLASFGILPLVLLNWLFVGVIGVVVFRNALILPAAALGKSFGIGDSSGAMKGTTGTLISIIVIQSVVQFALQYLAEGLMFLPVLGISAQVAVAAFVALINISLLTTLYGHYVEGREIT